MCTYVHLCVHVCTCVRMCGCVYLFTPQQDKLKEVQEDIEEQLGEIIQRYDQTQTFRDSVSDRVSCVNLLCSPFCVTVSLLTDH